jgi:hypothetical protein
MINSRSCRVLRLAQGNATSPEIDLSMQEDFGNNEASTNSRGCVQADMDRDVADFGNSQLKIERMDPKRVWHQPIMSPCRWSPDRDAAHLLTGRGYKYSSRPRQIHVNRNLYLLLAKASYLCAVHNPSCPPNSLKTIGIRTRLTFGPCTLLRIESF